MERRTFLKVGASATVATAWRFAFPWAAAAGNRYVSYAGSLWRAGVAGRIETSADGGRSWDREGALTGADRDAIIEEEGDEECGNPLPVRATDLAAVDMGGVVQVVASLERGGVWRRNHDGTWTILTIDTLRELVDRDRPPPPVVTELDAPRSPEVPDSSVPAETPTPGCPSPTQRTVTPNPLNGPPTTYDVCP